MLFPQRSASRRNTRRRGVIVILVAVSLAAIMIFVAISLDGGGLLERRRMAQAAADAAALAAANDLFVEYPQNQGVDIDGTAEHAALAAAALNGFSNDGTTSIVNVRTSPETYVGGPNVGLPLPEGYVEVSVQYNQQRYFSAVTGSGTIPVRARAVARGSWEAANVGIHVLDLHEPASLTATGESFIVVKGASVIINSDAAAAATSTGGSVSASPIKITGGTSVSGTKGGFYGDIQYGTPPEPDPLRHIPEPSSGGYGIQSEKQIKLSNGQLVVAPGTYRGGISVSGQGSLNMQPGIYFMDGGGFNFSGQGNLYADGVMIFNAPKQSSDTISITGTGSITMSPPDDGLYRGLTLFQARSSGNTMTVSGGGYMDIIGTFYTANGLLKVGGNGDSRVGSQYISRFLAIVGGGGLLIDYDKEEAIPRRIVQLIE